VVSSQPSSHDGLSMSWYPPWSLSERTTWAKARPWLASFYSSLSMSVVFGVLVAVLDGTKLGVVTFLVSWLILWPTNALAIKRRWGLRPEGEGPAPSIRRPWSEVSDRGLTIYMWISAFAAVFLTIGLATDSGRSPLAPVSIGCSIMFLLVTWNERRHRRNSP
jgi:hypothetical protein